MLNKALVLILTYNEEIHIARVIADVKGNLPDADILVVDGESSDNTQPIAKKMGAWVISVPSSLGIAGGMEAGLMFAREQGYDYLIRIDGDGQHEAREINHLIHPVVNGQADLAIGSRFKAKESTYKTSLTRSLANRLFSFLVSILAGEKIYDTTSGFQVLNGNAVDFLCQLRNFEYSEVETIILLKKAGFKIQEVPVTMKPRVGNQSSFNFIRAFFYVFTGFLSLLFTINCNYRRRQDFDD